MLGDGVFACLEATPSLSNHLIPSGGHWFVRGRCPPSPGCGHAAQACQCMPSTPDLAPAQRWSRDQTIQSAFALGLCLEQRGKRGGSRAWSLTGLGRGRNRLKRREGGKTGPGPEDMVGAHAPKCMQTLSYRAKAFHSLAQVS